MMTSSLRASHSLSVPEYSAHRDLGCAPRHDRCFQFLSSPDTPIYQKDIKGHFGCVNAIEASPNDRFLASGGDDRRVLMWSVASVQTEADPKPLAIMNQTHHSNIFSVAFSNKCDWLYSAGNDTSLIVHDINTLNMLHKFKAAEAIYNVATSPIDDTMIMSASEDGKVRLYDLRAFEETVVVRSRGTMYCAQFSPRQANLISVCNGVDGLSIHDCRKLDKPVIKLGDSENRSNWGRPHSVMYGEWSASGDAIFATRSQQPPIYYNLNDGSSIEFKDPGYLNSCTVKSCSFISDDMVMTGSDDWNIYVWKVPQDTGKPKEDESYKVEKAYRVLKGHRSIVNHARYSEHNRMLFSSGVEKVIKVWSGFEMNGYYADPVRRSMMTRPSAGEPRNDDSVEENLNMLAFFDLLTATGGDDEEMTDVEDELVEGDTSMVSEDDNSDESENAEELRWLAFARLRSRRVRRQEGVLYVISSPELSEAELLSNAGSDSEQNDNPHPPSSSPSTAPLSSDEQENAASINTDNDAAG